MGLINYLTNIYRRAVQESRRKLFNDVETVFVGLNRLISESKLSAKLEDLDAFEHDMVSTRRSLSEYERFRERLLKKELYHDAYRLRRKIDDLRVLCENARQRYNC